jgi:glutathione synthase/RimK-type ligase-like ATP-grasp enzyme
MCRPTRGASVRRVTVALIGSSANDTNVELIRAWRSLGLDARLLDPGTAARRLGPGDVAIGRLDVLPTLDGVQPGLAALTQLTARGVRVLNDARALLGANDKLWTERLLAAAGVPHVPTSLLRPGERLLEEPPFVVKPRFGAGGRDVVRCDTAAERAGTVAALAAMPWFKRYGALVQPYLPPLGHELRILVAGTHVAGATIRVTAPGEWRTSHGRTEVPAAPRPAASALALAAVAALGGHLLGVDLLPTPNGYVVLDVNACVDFGGTHAPRRDQLYHDVATGLELLAQGAERPPARVLPLRTPRKTRV